MKGHDIPSPQEPKGETYELAPGMVYLRVVEGRKPKAIYPLDRKDMVLGRQDVNSGLVPDLDLTDQEDTAGHYLSRRHARLIFAYKGLWIEDLGSANGTALNGEALLPATLTHVDLGDLIALGGEDLVLRVERSEQ